MSEPDYPIQDRHIARRDYAELWITIARRALQRGVDDVPELAGVVVDDDEQDLHRLRLIRGEKVE